MAVYCTRFTKKKKWLDFVLNASVMKHGNCTWHECTLRCECFLYIIFSGIFGLHTVFLLPFEIHCSYLIKSPPLHSEVKLSVQYFHLDCLALQPDSFKTPSRLKYQLLATSRVTVMAPEVVMGAPKILLLNPVSCLFAVIQKDDWKIQGKRENKRMGLFLTQNSYFLKI